MTAVDPKSNNGRSEEIHSLWDNCENDNLCKGEVEAKNTNKAYAPEPERRMRRNRSAGIVTLAHSLYNHDEPARAGRLAHSSYLLHDLHRTQPTAASAEEGNPITKRDWIFLEGDKLWWQKLFCPIITVHRHVNTASLFASEWGVDRGFYSKNNTPEQKLIIL